MQLRLMLESVAALSHTTTAIGGRELGQQVLGGDGRRPHRVSRFGEVVVLDRILNHDVDMWLLWC